MISPPSVLINGEPRETLSVLDRGLQYGDGLFETIRIVDGRCQYWDEHVDRLELGCEKLGIQFPGRVDLGKDADSLIQPSQMGVLKIIVTRGVSERGFRINPKNPPNRVVLLVSQSQYPAKYYSEGVELVLCKQRLGNSPQLAGIKHLNRLEQVLARREWDDEYQEGLLLDQFGRVAEGTMSNVFIVEGQCLITPELETCGVHGVIREQIIKKVDTWSVKIKRENFTKQRLLEADAVFMTNSIFGVWPVRSFEKRSWKPHPLIPCLLATLGFST